MIDGRPPQRMPIIQQEHSLATTSTVPETSTTDERPLQRLSILEQERRLTDTLTAPETSTQGPPHVYAASPWTMKTTKDLKEWVAQDPGPVMHMIKLLRKDYEDTREAYNHMVDQVKTYEHLVPSLQALKTSSESSNATVQADGPLLKLPDPPIFTDGKDPSIDDWLGQMRRKLRIDEDRYPSDEDQIAYIYARVGGLAAKHLKLYSRVGAEKPCANACEAFDAMEFLFGDPHRNSKTLSEFKKLRYVYPKFKSFWTEFQRLAADSDYSKDKLIDELKKKLSGANETLIDRLKQDIAGDNDHVLKFRRQIAAGDGVRRDLYTFARHCQYVENELREIDRQQAVCLMLFGLLLLLVMAFVCWEY